MIKDSKCGQGKCCQDKGTNNEEPKKCGDKAKELTEDLQRLQAEFENYKKRVAKEQEAFRNFATANLMNDLLDVLDNFELALKNTDNKEEFVKGVELIYAQLFSTLKERGLKEIEAKGKKFDPYLHEALLSEANDGEENIVLEVLQKGFIVNDKVIRHSKVKVSKK